MSDSRRRGGTLRQTYVTQCLTTAAGCELLRKGAESSPNCRQSYQFCPAEVINRMDQKGRQFDSRLRI